MDQSGPRVVPGRRHQLGRRWRHAHFVSCRDGRRSCSRGGQCNQHRGFVGAYGGYFGAGIGIITLAALGLLVPMDIHTLNARKTVLASIVNGAAAGPFVAKGIAHLPAAGVMAIGSISGGYLGASLARRVPASFVSAAVVAIGMFLTAILFYRGVGIR